MLIQWRRKAASMAYEEGGLVPFTPGTVLRLTMWTNYIQSPYTATYSVYGQRA
jgi:hypothetical protein